MKMICFALFFDLYINFQISFIQKKLNFQGSFNHIFIISNILEILIVLKIIKIKYYGYILRFVNEKKMSAYGFENILLHLKFTSISDNHMAPKT